jgi:hypothetical protein
MSRRVSLGLFAGGIALQLGLLGGALAFLPGSWRVALAFAVLALLPGAAIVRLGLVPPGGAWLAPMWAAGFGIAWNALLVLATRALGLPFTVLAGGSVATTAALWLAVIVVGRPPAAQPATPVPAPAGAGAEPLGRSRWALAAVLAAALLAALHAGRLGTPVTYYSDSPDHIGTVRRMMTDGDAFPRDAFFRDAGEAGVDPRKALWHPQVALIATLARVEAVEAWTWASAAIAPLFILNAAAFGGLAAGARGAAATAWAALLLGAGAIGWAPLRKAVFSTFLADQLCFAAAIAWLADLGAGTRRSRAAPVLLALSAVLVHLYSALQLAITAGAYLAGLAARDRGMSPALRRAAGTAAAMAVASLPFVLWRALHAGPAANVIHTEPQGLMWLAGSVRVVSPGVLWDWIGGMWMLFPLAWWPLWRHGRRNDATLYLLTTSLGVAAVLFTPPVVSWLEPRVGYLLMRVVWMLPTAGLVGLCAVALIARLLAPAAAGARGRIAAFAGALLLLYGLFPFARDTALTLFRPGPLAAFESGMSPLAWRADLRWMDGHLAPGSVVLSDPATSYAIPMLSGLYVVSLVDQHSSPRDPDALRRLLDARDALDPYAGWARTREVVRRYGVSAIALNGRFESAPRFNYWAPSREWYRAARARLDLHPEAFERIYDQRDFTVYRVRTSGLDSLEAPAPPRPGVERFESGRFGIARRAGDDSPALHGLMLWPRVVAPGDTLHAVAEWRALGALAPASYRVAVRFDRALPGGFAPPRALAKPARKVLERVNRELYRFRSDHLPAGGTYGVDLWRPDEVVRDSFTVAIPRAAAGGDYAVEIKMYRTPHYPNFRLSDYFFDRDYFSGLRAGAIRVARGGPGADPGPAAPPDISGGH